MMKFLRRFFHFHRWVIVHKERCTGVFSSILGNRPVEGSMIIEECSCCGYRQACFEAIDGRRDSVSLSFAESSLVHK